MIFFSENNSDFKPIPSWVRFCINFGATWPRSKSQPRRIALVSMPCDTPAAALITLGAMVRDLGDPSANDVTGQYDKLLKYANQFLNFCKDCRCKCNPKKRNCGFSKEATGRLRKQNVRGTVKICDQTDFESGTLKWTEPSGRNSQCIVTPEPAHAMEYFIDGELPCEWRNDDGRIPDWPYDKMCTGIKILPENFIRSFSGLCFAGRATGKSASKEMCDLFSFNDQNVTYSLSQLLGIQDWSAEQVSRVNYFNTRTNKFDRNIGMPTLVVADGDLSFHRVFDHSDFNSCDIIGVISRTMESDRLESLGLKMQPSLWYEPDCESINEIAALPKGISITVLKRRASI